MGLWRGRTANLIGPTLLLTESSYILGKMSGGSPTSTFAPIDLNPVTSDKTTPSTIHRQIKERSPTGLYALARKKFAGFRVEKKGN